MKWNRTTLFIIISSVALLIILGIQVNWILQTAKIKAELFNEKANMVLSRTAETLSLDEETCRSLGNCVEQNEIDKIDSLITHNMHFYSFYIDYSFEVKQPSSTILQVNNPPQHCVFNKLLEEKVSENGLELVLFLPERKQFILAEMGLMFMTSIVLVFVVIILFWKTVKSLLKEKKIAEHTTDFFNNMTHEFKTPLTNIALAGKMITNVDPNESQEKIKHYSGIILEENEKLRSQVEQVLSMAAFERGEIPIRKKTLNFHQLIHDAIKCMRIQIENNGGHLTLDLDADDCIVNGDKTHLSNTLYNLIDNAIKYTHGAPEISIKTFNSDNNLIIQISDNGIGIAKEYQKKVFDQFFRIPTGNIHDVKGFGLGLAYVKEVIELHEGKIELKSEKGIGTTFTITLSNE